MDATVTIVQLMTDIVYDDSLLLRGLFDILLMLPDSTKDLPEAILTYH